MLAALADADRVFGANSSSARSLAREVKRRTATPTREADAPTVACPSPFEGKGVANGRDPALDVLLTRLADRIVSASSPSLLVRQELAPALLGMSHAAFFLAEDGPGLPPPGEGGRGRSRVPQE